MRLLALTLILAVTAVEAASAQSSYSSYSGGQRLLRRRPFAPMPGGEVRTVVEPEFAAPPAYTYHPQQQPSRGPIYSPYASIRYEDPAAETLPPPIPSRARGVPAVPSSRPDPRPEYLPQPNLSLEPPRPPTYGGIRIRQSDRR